MKDSIKRDLLIIWDRLNIVIAVLRDNPGVGDSLLDEVIEVRSALERILSLLPVDDPGKSHGS